MVEMFPAYYIFNGLLSILLVLHVIWTYFILKMAYFSVYAKEVLMYLKSVNQKYCANKDLGSTTIMPCDLRLPFSCAFVYPPLF